MGFRYRVRECHMIEEFECPKCNGKGSYKVQPIKDNIIFDAYCFRCDGKGKLDWIDNIVIDNIEDYKEIAQNFLSKLNLQKNIYSDEIT